MEELEALIEEHNPDYERKCKQRTQDKWEPLLTQDGLFTLVEYSVHPNPLPMRSMHDGEHDGLGLPQQCADSLTRWTCWTFRDASGVKPACSMEFQAI